MEEKYRELLQLHHEKFKSAIDVERLYPILQSAQVLVTDDILEINKHARSEDKVDKLLDIIQQKPNYGFERLCMALETTYPHLLTAMFLGQNRSAVPREYTTTDSQSLSLTSDSEEDVLSNTSHSETRSQELEPSGKTYTRIIPSYEYDYETTHSQDEGHRKTKQTIEKGKRISAMNGENRIGDRQREFDRLKLQCERAMNEVSSLKQMQEDAVRKCDQAMRESEMHRSNYKTALIKLQQSKDDIVQCRAEMEKLEAEKKILEQELMNYQNLHEEDKQEISDLQKQQRAVLTEKGSTDVMNRLYEETLEKYHILKDKNEHQRKQNQEIFTKYEELTNKFSLCTEENIKLHKQNESLSRERESLILERNVLKQQCTAAIRDLAKVTQQRDEMIKESTQLLAQQVRKYETAAKERDAARNEYSLVWAERDSVHKEIEQLQDKLNEFSQKNQTFEKEKQVLEEEKEMLRRELLTAIQQKDEALKERDDAHKRYGDVKSKNDDLENQRDDFRKDYVMATQERDIARKERHEAIKDRDKILRETYERERTQKEQAEEIDQVSKETEALKKIIEKLQHDLTDAKHEAEKSKKNRDWALGERDKIVQEREGIRSLCESLRHQRDRAVSDKAQALRDYDNIKKEKMEACKDLKEIREKYESVMEKEARKNQLNGVGHNHSRDSAIDADLQELETEIVEVEISGLNPDNLGFDLVGGKDDPQLPNDYSVYVSHVVKGSVADGKLKINDVVLKINNMDVTNVEKRTVLQSIRNSSHVSLLVRRRRCITPRIWQPIQLNLSLGKDIGIHIEQGLYIARIVPGSTVAKEGMLSTGDRIVCVNGASVENYTPTELMKLLEGCCDPVVIDVWRQMSPMSSSPIPVLQRDICTLPEQISPNYSKSENLKSHSMWNTNMTVDGGKNGMKVKSSGSQTDSLDSPPSSTSWGKESKSEKDLEHKSRGGGTHMFDKAKEKLKMFKPRLKNQDRNDLDEGQQKVSQVSGSVATNDKVITEFNFSDAKVKPGQRQKNGRKREFENENSGTWPKCYRGQPSMQGTMVMPSPQKHSDRPSIKNFFSKGSEKTPPIPPERTEASHIAVRQSPHHSPQSSDSTIKCSHSPISSPPINSKSANYLHNGGSSNPHPMPFTFNPDSAILPQDSQHIRHLPPKTRNARRNAPSSHSHYDVPNINPREVWEGNRAIRSRPRSAEKEKHRHSAHWPQLVSSSQFHSSNDSSSSGLTSLLPGYPPPPAPSTFASDLSAFESPPPFHERHRVSHNSGGSSLVVRPHPFHPYQGHVGQGSTPVSSPSFSPSFSSPTGSYPDPEFDRRPSPYYDFMCSSPCPSQLSSTPSEQFNYNIPGSRTSSYGRMPSDFESTGAGTFPKKNRIWIPPNVPSSNKSSGSVEVVSARNSPTSPMFPEDSVTSLESLTNRRRKPLTGETRKINVERNTQFVGFTIASGPQGGVFVSSVHEDSLAKEAGLVIGDQLLEICGINMRTATEDMAAKFLRQTGNTLSLLVQYNPDEYNKTADSSGESTGTSPLNSPDSDIFRRKEPSLRSINRKSIVSSDIPCEKPRWISIRKSSPNDSLGISIVSRSNSGIFVKEVQPNSFVYGHDGLRTGDQILEYNNVDFTSISLEKAKNELYKPCSYVQMSVQFNPTKYQQLCCESFYVRAHFDHKGTGEGELSFRRDDIMLIDNIFYDGKSENWFAWLVNDDGQKLNKKGIIPSKEKLEEMELRRSHSESLSLHDLEETRGSTRRGSGSARSSFFRRRGKHKRNGSKDSREFNSFSETSLTSDSVPVLEDFSFNKYTKVERMEYKFTRPVIMLAPLAESLIKKLVAESPDKYAAGQPTIMQTTKQVMEQGLADGIYIDYWQEDEKFQCIRIATIKEICDQGKHCLLNISPAAIERLHRLQIYPIVVFARHRSHKQLRDVTDPQFLSQKLSAKSAKELFDKFHKLERDYQHQFSAVIQGGNLAEMHQQVKTVIANEQKKAIWVPVCPVV